jgi:UDP-N-acetylglucosamine--N-acetylmuramyl-(pentapeptide) pyrophosphoryl-undecaprenol N-acetylglucosamine transferase
MRLLVSGGGTGGHVYPALAIAGAVREQDPGVEVLYVGTADGLEADIVPGEGLPFEAIPSRGLVGKGLLRAPAGVAVAVSGVAAAWRIMKRFRPDVSVGTGGYVSGPVAVAAGLSGVPLVLHEQNVFPGLTNRLASRWAAAVAVPFEEARRYFPRGTRVVVTGNPVRRSVIEMTREEGLSLLGLPPDGLVVYAVGGSRGAQVLNEAVVEALPGWLELPGVRVIFATGRRYYDRTVAALRERGISVRDGGKIILAPYMERADAALAAADVVVTRAGGITLAEITSRGVPAVVVPSPNVVHRHQDYNAEVLRRAGAAKVIPEAGLAGPVLEKAVRDLLRDPEVREKMRQASRGLGRPEAAAALARLVLEAGRGRRAG